jgi:hypothetical protein|tara:strand:+ start:2192 stop:2578 length:387 start_codon:yes stop_codon:yes gene_type:complete
MLECMIESAIRSKGAHYDLAAIIYFFYKDDYKVVNDKWFKKVETDIKWQEMETPNDLYINISRKIFDVLMEQYDKLYQQSKVAETLDMSDLYKEKARKLHRIANNCKMVNYKNSLIRECKPLFTVEEL